MKFSTTKEILIKPLSILSNISTIKQTTFPVLSNVLLSFSDNKLTFIATDLEIELSYSINFDYDLEISEFTLPCKKLFDIVRNLIDGSLIKFEFIDNKVTIKSGKSRFVLSCIPAVEFPKLEASNVINEFDLSHQVFRNSVLYTEFCMATKDVRFYLNGLLLELTNHQLKYITTDGHRLAYYENDEVILKFPLPDDSKIQLLIPRKSILELLKLLKDDDALLHCTVTHNYLQVTFENLILSTKLIDSKFPEYNRVIPNNTNISIQINREELKDALIRSSVLSSDKFKAVRFDFSENKLRISIHNPEHEEAIEELFINYTGNNFTIGFNITYILDILTHIIDNNIIFNFTESYNSCIIQAESSDIPLYVVMPMRI